MPKVICPECDGDVQIDAATATGDIIECDNCGVELEVSGLDPVELDILDNDEDFEEEDDEY